MNDGLKRTPMSMLDKNERIKNFDEVELGYTKEEAKEEASRCLQCKNPMCMKGCPVGHRIPEWIKAIKEDRLDDAYKIISEVSSLPAICGRVCPQEKQCEMKCVRGIKGDAIAIGALERYVADNVKRSLEYLKKESNGKRVAIVGSGPSGITCATDLAREGFDVTIYEALHRPGGVLAWVTEAKLASTVLAKLNLVPSLSDEIDGLPLAPMGSYYENQEIGTDQNSYVRYPYYLTRPSRARIKQDYIQKIPTGATSCQVVLSSNIFHNGKYKIGFAFYTSDYRQISSTIKGWYTTATTFTATPTSDSVYYMLYVAAVNSSDTVVLDELSNIGCSVKFDNSPKNFILQERLQKTEHDATVCNTITPNVTVINHRGYNVIAPENTIPAFVLSAKLGFKYVETDVLFTHPDNDNPLGVPVLLHDATINRTARNADGTTIASTINIADITYAQALEYDFGIWKSTEYAGTKIPTFEQFIKTCKRYGLHPYIELKDEKTYSQDEVDMILSIIVANGMKEHVSFISFSSAALQLVKNRWDWVELGCNVQAGIAACRALKTENNNVFVTHDKTKQIPAFMAEEFPACPYTVDLSDTLQSLNPYYSMILTNGLIPAQITKQMFAYQ